MKREDSRRKCGTATPRVLYRGYEAQEKPRDAACNGRRYPRPHPRSLSLALLPFSLFSLSFSQEKQLRYLGSVKSETGERICISGLCGPGLLHACSTCLRPKVCSFVICMFLRRGRLAGSEVVFARAPYLAWPPLIPR